MWPFLCRFCFAVAVCFSFYLEKAERYQDTENGIHSSEWNRPFVMSQRAMIPYYCPISTFSRQMQQHIGWEEQRSTLARLSVAVSCSCAQCSAMIHLILGWKKIDDRRMGKIRNFCVSFFFSSFNLYFMSLVPLRSASSFSRPKKTVKLHFTDAWDSLSKIRSQELQIKTTATTL